MIFAPRDPTMPHAPHTVFVIDDDLSVRESLELLIRSAAWCPRVFASAHEFLSRASGPHPSCVILDMGLLDMNGLSLQQLVAGELPKVPIIMITGYEDQARIDRALKAGAVECLMKPFGGEVLLSVIRRVVERTN